MSQRNAFADALEAAEQLDAEAQAELIATAAVARHQPGVQPADQVTQPARALLCSSTGTSARRSAAVSL